MVLILLKKRGRENYPGPVECSIVRRAMLQKTPY